MKQPFLITYPSVKFVEGQSRGLLMDLQKEKYYVIPLSLIFVLKELESQSYDAFIANTDLSDEQIETIQEYIDYLIGHDLVFWGNEADQTSLQRLDETYFSPITISNALFDFDEKNYLNKNIVTELNSLGAKAVQLRYYSANYLEILHEQLTLFERSTVRHIDLLIPFLENIEPFLLEILRKYDRISFITVYNAPKNQLIQDIDLSFGKLLYSTDKINNEKDCGKVSKLYFSCNINTYLESKLFNNCLNQKISIDKSGQIRNCPSMPISFGDITTTNLSEVAQNPAFRKYWHIKKDDIEQCKSCEFRYICTDCRAYTVDAQNEYAKPLKCGYNPATCEWEEWSDNPLKEKMIQFYNLTI